VQIYEVLKTEHSRILELFSRIGALPGGRQHEQLTEKVLCRIEALLDAEEYYLYPLLEIHPKTHDSTRRSHRQNNKMREVLREWRQTGTDNFRCRSLLSTLENLMRGHIAQEEHQLYVQAQYVIASEQAELLGERARGDLARARHRTAQVW
jgi:hemerythrin